MSECFANPSTQSLCYCLVYGGFFQQIAPVTSKLKAQPIGVCHPDQKTFVKSLVEQSEEDDRVGPKALHPWHYPPIFLVDSTHPTMLDIDTTNPTVVDNPGKQPHWTEKVEDREKWNGVVFRYML